MSILDEAAELKRLALDMQKGQRELIESGDKICEWFEANRLRASAKRDAVQNPKTLKEMRVDV